MRPPALLDLLARLLEEHRERGAGSDLVVVPTILVGDFDEIDEADSPVLRLLAAFARYADAAYADARDTATAGGGLVDDVALRAALTAALTIERPRSTQALTFDDDDVRLGHIDVALASDGERELLGLARSLLDPRWARHDVGVLTYSERNMDKPSVRAAWDAVTSALATPSVRLGSLRTLLVLVRAPRVFYDIHLSTERGAHYVLDNTRLVHRSSEAHVRAMAQALARGAGPMVLHLGAGFSYSSRLPLGDELRDDALRRRYGQAPNAEIRPLAVQLFRDAQRDQRLTPSEAQRGESAFADALTLEQVVRLESTMYSGTPRTLEDFAARHERAVAGGAVRALARVVGARRGLVLVTVNFDELIEAQAGASVRVFATDDDIAGFPAYLTRYVGGEEAAVPLLKLHGTISRPDSCVVNAEQTEAGLPLHKRAALHAIVGSRGPGRIPWTYIGASLRDIDVVPVLDDDLFRENVEESWVTPLRDASIDDFAERYRARAWRESGDRPDLEQRTISATADWFLEELAGQVATADSDDRSR